MRAMAASPSHVILAAGRTVTIDWDGYDVADPARDVARFIVALKRLALGSLSSIRALDAVADVFVQTYVGLGRMSRCASPAMRLPCVCRSLPIWPAKGVRTGR